MYREKIFMNMYLTKDLDYVKDAYKWKMKR